MKLRHIALVSLTLFAVSACGRSQPEAAAGPELPKEPSAKPVQYDSAEAAVAVGVVSPDGLPSDSQWIRVGGDETGPLSYGYVSDDKPVGFWTYHHPSGRIAMQGTYLYGGVKDGEWRLWHANGARLAVGSFDRDQRMGAWTRWHDNGARSSAGSYLNDERSGEWIAWHRNGRMKSQGVYVAGKVIGRWQQWNQQGREMPYTTFGHPQDIQPVTPADRTWDGMTELEGLGLKPYRPGGE